MRSKSLMVVFEASMVFLALLRFVRLSALRIRGAVVQGTMTGLRANYQGDVAPGAGDIVNIPDGLVDEHVLGVFSRMRICILTFPFGKVRKEKQTWYAKTSLAELVA